MIDKKLIAKQILANRILAKNKIDWSKILFKEQQDFFNDTSTLKAACCSRQAGKSFTAAAMLIDVALKNNESYVAYLALTRSSAKRIMWSELIRHLTTHKIKHTANLSDLVITLENKSTIYLLGANTTGVGETLRGSPWKLVLLDEVASFRSTNLTYIINECIIPSLITKLGQLVLIGTPAKDFSSYFYDIFHNNKGYSLHSWNILKNIAIPHAQQFIEARKKELNLDDKAPFIMREYYGKWVRDESLNVYSYFDPFKHVVDVVPAKIKWHYNIGVDLGGAGRDATAIVVLAYNPQEHRTSYVVHQEAHKKLTISELGYKLKQLQQQFNARIIMDCGALGLSISQEITTRFGISIEAAKKTEKLANMELMNDEFRNGYLKILDTSSLLQDELLQLIWKDDSRTLEHPSCNNHLSDSLLYCWKHSTAYGYEATPIKSIEQQMEDDIFEERNEYDY